MTQAFKKTLLVLVILQGIHLLFMNCSSQVEFSASELNKVASNAVDILDQNQDDILIPDSDDVKDDVKKEIVNVPSDEAPNPPPNTNGNPNLEVNFDCASYKELTGDVADIPNRGDQGVCYYIKLMEATPLHSSGSYGEDYDPSVLARMHSGHHGFSGPNAPPLVLGAREMKLKLGTGWKVAISSDPVDPRADMYIDNFFLIDVVSNSHHYFWAYGTADAEPKNSPILVGSSQEPVENFYSFAPGGTATVGAIEFTSSLPIGQNFDFQFRALDCGGSAESSEVYLVIY